MTRTILPVAAAALLTALPIGLRAQTAFDGPPQAARGYKMFHETAKPVACGNCHAVGGKGTAVGPDLKMWARLAPRATATAITSSVTEKVVEVKPKTGPSFAGIKVSEDEKGIKYFDVSAEPPAMREFTKEEAGTTGTNTAWKHPPSREKYTLEELADLVSYIRWAGAKDKKPVAPEDVQ